MTAFGGLDKIFDNVCFPIGKKLVDLAAKDAEREVLSNEFEGVLIMFQNINDVINDKDDLRLKISDASLVKSGEGATEKLVGFLSDNSFF